jgi:hypothetical protein
MYSEILDFHNIDDNNNASSGPVAGATTAA